MMRSSSIFEKAPPLPTFRDFKEEEDAKKEDY